MKGIQREEYLSSFPPDDEGAKIRSAALAEARDNRKFEIELYWKRAAYFWTFIAATFAGYFVVAKQPTDVTTSFVIASLGLVFSLAWFFVNRGSKYWQQNWETHVDLLEDAVAGPIYKTVVQPRKYLFWKFSDPYPFSVSKINQLLSLFVVFVWLLLITKTMAAAFKIRSPIAHGAIWMMIAATVIATILLARKGVTDNAEHDVEIDRIFRRKREYD